MGTDQVRNETTTGRAPQRESHQILCFMSTKHRTKVKPTLLQGLESSVQGMLDWELCASLKANNDVRKF